MEEPEKSPAALGAIQEVQITAQQNGHLPGEWKWDGHNSWRAWCRNRNCNASAWVTPSGVVGGSIDGECWIRRYNKGMGRKPG